MWKLIWHASVKFQISGMSKWVQFSFNCFWTPCVEKKTTEWQLLIQNANLWHGTVKMACHSQKAGVCYASHFSSVHATCPCIRQPLAFAFGTFLRGQYTWLNRMSSRGGTSSPACPASWETISLRKNWRKTGITYLFCNSLVTHVLGPSMSVTCFRSLCVNGI